MKTLQNLLFGALALFLSCWANADSYVYDKLNRLTSVTYTSGGKQTFTYDPAGNMLTLVSTPPAVASTTTTTSTSTTLTTSTTTVTSTTTTTQPGNTNLTVPFVLVQGWNLLGNSLAQPLPLAPALSDPALVLSVWKWDATLSGWQFYSPALDATALQAYAASKNYGVLSVINQGEGYWVNAKAPRTLASQTGPAFGLAAANLHSGWNLVATGHDVSPSTFNTSLSAVPPAPSVVPLNLTSLWAWDSVGTRWYFYSPALEASGGLGAYIAGKGYLDFSATGKTLGNGVGFWVNKP